MPHSKTDGEHDAGATSGIGPFKSIAKRLSLAPGPQQRKYPGLTQTPSTLLPLALKQFVAVFSPSHTRISSSRLAR